MFRNSQMFDGSGLPLRVIEHITRGALPRVSVDAFGITFTLAGASEAVSDSEAVPLRPGSILFVPSADPIACTTGSHFMSAEAGTKPLGRDPDALACN